MVIDLTKNWSEPSSQLWLQQWVNERKKNNIKNILKNEFSDRYGDEEKENRPWSDFDYNCGGFALHRKDWVKPYCCDSECEVDEYNRELDILTNADASNTVFKKNSSLIAYTLLGRTNMIENMAEEGYSDAEIQDQVMAHDTAFLLMRYPYLKQVKLSECSDSDRVICFRNCIRFQKNSEGEKKFSLEASDFHFKVRIDGIWYEKQGNCHPHMCHLLADRPWHLDEETTYDSKIVFFIDTRKEFENEEKEEEQISIGF